MHLRAAPAFGPVIPRPRAAFGCRLEGATIKDRCRGFCLAALGPPQHRAQILHDGVKHAGLEPALALLVHRRPRRQVMGHHPPRRACPDNPAQAIKDLAQAVLPLGGLCVMRVT